MKKKQCIEEIYKRHVDMVYRICFTYMKNIADTEDAVQTVFVKLMKSRKRFQNEEHEKAWLIVTATNTCKDLLKHWWRKNEDIQLFANTLSEGQKEPDFTEELVLSLPDRYKTVLYLYYYEEYDSNEIAKILHKRPQTIRALLSEGRKLVRKKLENESN